MKPMKRCIIYYGMKIPNIAKTRNLSDCHVVLQSYHPLYTQGLFAEFFPYCERYLYWNCSSLHQGEYHLLSTPLPVLGQNTFWQTYQLDLWQSQCRDYLCNKALEISENSEINGLFIDDSDQWGHNPSMQGSLMRLFQEIERQWTRPLHYFLNRGFFLWPKLKNIKAILLEGFLSQLLDSISYQDLEWIENILDLHLPFLHANKNISLFAIDYQPIIPNLIRLQKLAQDPLEKLKNERQLKLFEDLKPFISLLCYQDKNLATWPEECL